MRLRFRFLRGAMCAAVLAALCASQSHAVTIDWVPIGDPGNANDTEGDGYGAVADTYLIAKHEVSNTQYVEFLNAKDSTGANDLALYNFNMMNNANGGIDFTSGNADGSKYSVKSGRGNNPVNFVSWFDSIRFANWLNNGQGTGATETGAYTLGELGFNAIPTGFGSSITRNVGARIFLTSENEWYKAAYYNSGSASYVDYPTGTDVEPNSDQAPGALTIQSNVANFYRDTDDAGFNDGFAVTGSTGSASSVQNYLTDVGAYTGSSTLYGTFDQGGNLFEWNEALTSGSRGARGGSWINESDALLASSRPDGDSPADEGAALGFRVASIPEPTSSAIAVSAAIGFWWLRRRKR